LIQEEQGRPITRTSHLPDARSCRPGQSSAKANYMSKAVYFPSSCPIGHDG